MPKTTVHFSRNFTVMNDYQVLIEISGGVLRHYERRFDVPHETYVCVKSGGTVIYFEDFNSNRIVVFHPIEMAIYHASVDTFYRMSQKNKEHLNHG
jgi:hypothetical protein